MTTKPKLKKIPLPEGWPALPEGSVNLGHGNDRLEDVFLDHMDDLKYYCSCEDDEWDEGFWAGSNKTGFYAAPADSAIARKILGEPAKPVAKRKSAKKTVTKPAKTVTKSAKSKKTITLRKLPKNVKPGTKVVCIHSERWGCLTTKIGKVYTVDEKQKPEYGFLYLKEDTDGYYWGKDHFRLAPAKTAAKKANAARREARKTQKIGVIPAPKPRTPAIAPLAEKFGVEFVKSAMTQGIAIPDWLPALPPVPAGYDRWEPRGEKFEIGPLCVYGCASEGYAEFRTVRAGSEPFWFASFYIEAVRDEKLEVATDNASAHIELHQKEIERMDIPTSYTAEELATYWAQKGEEMRRNSAVGLLTEAAETIGARAAERDVESERSMAKCVAAFNVMFGKDITEEQGWLFMALLKMSRSTVGHRRDDFLDGAAYMSLAGESALNQEKP